MNGWFFQVIFVVSGKTWLGILRNEWFMTEKSIYIIYEWIINSWFLKLPTMCGKPPIFWARLNMLSQPIWTQELGYWDWVQLQNCEDFGISIEILSDWIVNPKCLWNNPTGFLFQGFWNGVSPLPIIVSDSQWYFWWHTPVYVGG